MTPSQANVLIADDGTARLCDFGLSKVTESADSISQHSALKGTCRWMAPELFDEDSAPHTKLSDIWACGCMFIEAGRVSVTRCERPDGCSGSVRGGPVPHETHRPASANRNVEVRATTATRGHLGPVLEVGLGLLCTAAGGSSDRPNCHRVSASATHDLANASPCTLTLCMWQISDPWQIPAHDILAPGVTALLLMIQRSTDLTATLKTHALQALQLLSPPGTLCCCPSGAITNHMLQPLSRDSLNCAYQLEPSS